MWIFKYLVCLMCNHSFIGITWRHSPYRYCLRCGKVEAEKLVKESVSVGDMDDTEIVKVSSH